MFNPGEDIFPEHAILVYMNIRLDHDRLQLFIRFQHAGYEVIASEHIASHAHHWGFPDYEPVVEVLSGTLT